MVLEEMVAAAVAAEFLAWVEMELLEQMVAVVVLPDLAVVPEI